MGQGDELWCVATTSRSWSPTASATFRQAVFQVRDVPTGTLLIQLGGPGMLIGLGGGAASSMSTGTNAEDLDFASVQRGDPDAAARAGGHRPLLAAQFAGEGHRRAG